MSEYTKLLWLLSPSRRVTFNKIQSTYGEILSRYQKIKEGRLVKSDLLNACKIGVISIETNGFTEETAMLVRDFQFFCESSSEPPKVIVGICSRDPTNMDNDIFIPLFFAPQTVTKVTSLK